MNSLMWQHLFFMIKNQLALLAVIVFSTHCLADQTEITLVTEHLPPYQMIHKDSSVTGFAVDVVQEVFKRADISYALHGYPWVRAYNIALKKSNYCIFSIARIPTRENLFTWIGLITEKNNAVIWALKSNEHGLKVKTLDDLKNYTTAVNKDDVTHTAMLNIGLTEDKNLYVLHHTESLIKLLVTRPEIDFIVADDITISHRAKLSGVPIDLLRRVIEVESLPLNFYLACNLKTEESILKKLKTSISIIHQDGTYQKIIAKWKKEMPHVK